VSSEREPRDRAPSAVVIGLGELLWDRSPDGRDLGGAPANFACQAGQLGAEAWMVSAVGQDADGLELTRQAQACGTHTCIAALETRATGRVDVDLGPDGQPHYRIADDSAWDHIPWNDQAANLAARADAVCFGTLAQRHPESRDFIRRFLDSAPPNALRIFDANLRAPYFDREIVQASLERADVLKVNDDEWAQIAAWFGLQGDFDAASQALRSRFDLQWILETKGARGSQAAGPDGVTTAPAAAVAAVDTVGAGDAFTATCCLGILKGIDPTRLLTLAADVATFVCSERGGTPRLPEPLINQARQQLDRDH